MNEPTIFHNRKPQKIKFNKTNNEDCPSCGQNTAHTEQQLLKDQDIKDSSIFNDRDGVK